LNIAGISPRVSNLRKASLPCAIQRIFYANLQVSRNPTFNNCDFIADEDLQPNATKPQMWEPVTH